MHDLSQERCVIIGAGGFIGANLCVALRSRVLHLRAFGRRMIFPEALKGIEWIQGDFRDPTVHQTILAGCSTLIHLVSATNPADSNVNMVADLEANVISTLHLLNSCRGHEVKRIVFISSGGTIYGIPRQIPTPEESTLEPITAYGVSKATIERYLHLHAHLYGLEYLTLRVSNPYGPYQRASKGQGIVATVLRKALRDEAVEIWGDGSIVRDYLHVDDVTCAISAAIAYRGSYRTFNIGSGEGRSVNELIALIEEAVERPVRRIYKAGRKIDVERSVLNIQRARDELKWTPATDIVTGLRQTAEWMRRDIAETV